MDFIMIGVFGLSSLVGTWEILFTRSMPSVTWPNTGCWDGVDLSHQSRKLLWATLMKNWLPPVFGWPVFAMLSVPGSFEIFWVNSSGMLPPLRTISAPVEMFLYLEFGCGPPVPALRAFGSFAYGQPNWFMKSGITGWKWIPL